MGARHRPQRHARDIDGYTWDGFDELIATLGRNPLRSLCEHKRRTDDAKRLLGELPGVVEQNRGVPVVGMGVGDGDRVHLTQVDSRTGGRRTDRRRCVDEQLAVDQGTTVGADLAADAGMGAAGTFAERLGHTVGATGAQQDDVHLNRSRRRRPPVPRRPPAWWHGAAPPTPARR